MMCDPGRRNLFHWMPDVRSQRDNETPLSGDEDVDGDEDEEDEEEGGNRGERGSVAFPRVTRKMR